MQPIRSSRRDFIVGAGACGVSVTLAIRPAAATPEMLAAAIHTVVGHAKLNKGKVKLELPQLVENGNTVALAVSVESPMTATEYVRAIHLFNEKNPQANIASFHLGPRSGRASVATRIRLADTQTVTAIAELSDGSFWTTDAYVIVTLAACTEGAI